MSEAAYSRLNVDERRRQVLEAGSRLFAEHAFEEIARDETRSQLSPTRCFSDVGPCCSVESSMPRVRLTGLVGNAKRVTRIGPMANKTCFITGTARGFGREWATAALDRGDRVAATPRDPSTLDDLRSEHGDALLALTLDVTDREAAFAA